MALSFLIFIIIGAGYVLNATIGLFEDNPEDRLYNRLLSGGLYFRHLLWASVLLIFGVYRIYEGNDRDVWAISPFIFLVLLRPINSIVKAGTGRNILIYTRWEKRPDNYSFFLDGITGFFLIVIPLVVPGYIMNKLIHGNLII